MLSVLKGNLTYILQERLDIDDTIVPVKYVQNQVIRDQGIHHITLITKNEMNISRSQMKALSVKLKNIPGWDKIEILGVGCVQKDNEETYYYIVLWPVANKFRRSLGLSSKYLHVTLGFKNVDIHGINKGVTTLLPKTINPKVVSFLDILYKEIEELDDQLCKEFLDILNLVGENCKLEDSKMIVLLTLRSKISYRLKNIDSSLEDCLELMKIDSSNVENKLRIAHLYNLKDKVYIALRYYKHVNILNQIDESYKQKAINGIQLCYKKMSTNVSPRIRHIVDTGRKEVRLSRNFSWVIPDKLAGISIPKSEDEIDAFEFMNIGLIVSVLEEEKLPSNWFKDRKYIRNIHYNVKNYNPPSFEEMDEIIDEMENTIKEGKAVLVHCGGGKGRAGTVLACFVLKNGLEGDVCNITPHKTGKAAIELIREMRPGSIETRIQEDFIKEYGNRLWKNTKQ